MKLRYKIGIGFLLFITLAILALGVAVSYDEECPPPARTSVTPDTMKSVRYYCYGAPEVLRLENIEKPSIANNEILVKVHAAGVNPLDWHYMRGAPYIMRLGSGLGAPTDHRMGVDFSGTVEAVGSNVTRFRPGDQVFGGSSGAFAEYLKVSEDRAVALKPNNVSFDEAASVAIAGVTALQALRDSGQVQAGHKVLINGASGGVGTFAVQIAKAMGAEVTGVCSTRNVGMVRGLGADHVIDYKNENFTQQDKRYDVIIDMVSNHSLGDLRGVMEPEGALVMVGSNAKGNFIGPLLRPLWAAMNNPFVSQELKPFLATMKQDDMVALAELMRAGQVRPVLDREFELREIREAMDYSESGRARGKIIIDVR